MRQRCLTKAFEEITGIKVAFDLIQEGDVIEKLQTQWASGKNIYDGWVLTIPILSAPTCATDMWFPWSDFMKG